MVGVTQEKQIMLRLFENISIKHYNIMNSRKTNLRLIQVLNMASVKKDISFHVPKFLAKMIFQLTFAIIK